MDINELVYDDTNVIHSSSSYFSHVMYPVGFTAAESRTSSGTIRCYLDNGLENAGLIVSVIAIEHRYVERANSSGHRIEVGGHLWRVFFYTDDFSIEHFAAVLPKEEIAILVSGANLDWSINQITEFVSKIGLAE